MRDLTHEDIDVILTNHELLLNDLVQKFDTAKRQHELDFKISANLIKHQQEKIQELEGTIKKYFGDDLK